MNDNYSDIMIDNSFEGNNDDADTTRNKKDKSNDVYRNKCFRHFFLNSVKRGTKRQREHR